MLKEIVFFFLSMFQAFFLGHAMQDDTQTLAHKAARALVSSPVYLASIPSGIPPAIKTQLIETLAAARGYPLQLSSKKSLPIYKGVCVVEGDIEDHRVIAIDCDGKLVSCADNSFTDCNDWHTDTDPNAFVWDATHEYMIVGERNGHMAVLDPKNKKIIYRARAHQAQNYLNQVESLTLKDDLLLSTGGDGLVRLWDAQNYEKKRDYVFVDPVKNAYITHLKQLISATKNGKVQVSDIETGAVIRTSQISPEALSRMKLLQDPNLTLVTHCNRISGYDIRQTRLAFSIAAHSAPITTLDVQKVDQFASGSFDKTVKVWDARILERFADLQHTQWVQSLSHGPDFLISGSRDATVRIWDAQPLHELQNLAVPLSLQWMHISD
jgi:WD40 repeat protein